MRMKGIYLVIQQGKDGYVVISAHEKMMDAFNAASALKENHGSSQGEFKVKWVELE